MTWFKTISLKTDEKHWIIKSDESLVGVVNLKHIDQTNKNAEWAFYLGEVETRGKGVGILIEYELIEFVFNDLNLNKLNCTVLDFNKSVIELHKKFGFVEEGKLRKQIFKNGEYIDVILLGLLHTEWTEKKHELIKVVNKLKGIKTQ